MRIGDSCWFCKKLDKEIDGQFYAKPQEIVTRARYFTVMGKSGNSDIVDLGLDEQSRLTAIAQPYARWKDTFSNGDLFYVNGLKPSEDEDYYGQNANYRVADVDYGNSRIRLRLEKVAE